MTEKEFNELKPGDKVTLLPWKEARKAVCGTTYECGDSIYGISDFTWKRICRTNEFVDHADDYENLVFNKLYKFIRVHAAGFTWLIPKCCVVGKEEKRIAGRNDIIEIFARGNKIIAKRDKKVGIARRSPMDKADEAKGVIIAVARLYGYDVVTDEEGKVTLADKKKIIKEIGDEPTEKPSGEKEYELLPWDEALKAAEENDPDDVAVDNTEICYLSKASWEKLRKSRIIRIEAYVGNGRLRYITVEQPKGETDMFYVPACCIREKGEKTMKEETAKDRVKKELAELEEKIEKLARALAPLAAKVGTDTEAYNLLNRQLDVMRIYAEILRRRLAIWKD